MMEQAHDEHRVMLQILPLAGAGRAALSVA
jgi:hypothetical protein